MAETRQSAVKVLQRLAIVLLASYTLCCNAGVVPSSSGYYLGWAEVTPVGSEIRVSFNPIDCDVASLVAILPQTNGVLIAHFDVPLVDFSDEPGSPQPEKIVAKKAQLVADRTVKNAANPPNLILGKNWDFRGIEVASGRSFKRAELALLTQKTVDSLVSAELFGKVTVMKRRNHDGDPLRVLEPLKTSARDFADDVEVRQDAAKSAANRIPTSYPNRNGNIGPPSEQNPGTDSRAIPTLARVISTNEKNRKLSVSACCHILLFYGLGPTDLPILPSGVIALKALTDEQTAIQTFGRSPFVRTRSGLRYYVVDDPLGRSQVGEAHRDTVLATFAAMNFALSTPIHLEVGTYSVSNLLSESVANFSFEQGEPAWTAMAFAKYLPPKTEWVNRFRERTSFSQLANRLLTVDMARQSCAGTHIFEALVKIDQADRSFSILDEKTRKQIHSYLQAKVEQVMKNQEVGGAWNWNWCDSINRKAPITLREYILITGHILEALNALDSNRRPPDSVFVRAAGWLNQSLVSEEIPTSDDAGSWLCPFTHAARSLREIMRNKKRL